MINSESQNPCIMILVVGSKLESYKLCNGSFTECSNVLSGVVETSTIHSWCLPQATFKVLPRQSCSDNPQPGGRKNPGNLCRPPPTIGHLQEKNNNTLKTVVQIPVFFALLIVNLLRNGG